ncbi:MAG: Coq4 family protein [Rhizomicrobium sp.]
MTEKNQALDHSTFEQMARTLISSKEAERLAQAAKIGDSSACLKLAAALAGAAFGAPEHTGTLYDAIARGWSGTPVKAAPLPATDKAPLPLTREFWAAFWNLIDTRASLDAGGVTLHVAALGAHVSPDFQQRAADACLAYPGVTDIDVTHMPARVQLDDLAKCPIGSLGNAFYRLITDNKFDLEVLDRDALALGTLMPPLNYLNTRILQAHDLWHIVGGYDVTQLHEIAISAFQLAQFGHSYSAMFLAFIAAASADGEAAGFTLAMETIVSAWKHGRETPPMMRIEWENVWQRSAQSIREEYGITPYCSPYPADILEQLSGLRA